MDSLAGEEQNSPQITSPRLQQEAVAVNIASPGGRHGRLGGVHKPFNGYALRVIQTFTKPSIPVLEFAQEVSKALHQQLLAAAT